MWTYEHTLEAAVTPESVWGLWADVANWGSWNADIEKIDINGPFAPGAEITMVSAGQDPVVLTLADVAVNERFVDEAHVNGLVLRTMHHVEPLAAGRVRIVYRMDITGEGADEIGPKIGPDITADWPDTMRALAEAAGRAG